MNKPFLYQQLIIIKFFLKIHVCALCRVLLNSMYVQCLVARLTRLNRGVRWSPLHVEVQPTSDLLVDRFRGL